MKNSKLDIGLMSGTSLDGVDAALVEISGFGSQAIVNFKHFTSNPFPDEIRKILLKVSSGEPVSSGIISNLNVLLGQIFSQAVLKLCSECHLTVNQIDLIGSHGQTIFHQSEPRKLWGHTVASSLQIGEAAILVEQTGVTVVSDFRPRDLAAGGTGAPLIPYVDFVLFRDPILGRVLLNLGGIANLTILPPKCQSNQIRAFDTGPGNMLIDDLTRHFSQGEKQFDAQGQQASSGKIIVPVLENLLSDPFFKKKPPKSAGREQFGQCYTKRILAMAELAQEKDIICTATELTVRTIADAIFTNSDNTFELNQLIVSGGGVHNTYLIQRLKNLLPHLEIMTTDDFKIPSDAKEAIGFAILANETFEINANNVPSATGATHPVVLGKISYGQNYRKLRGFN